MLNYQRVSSRQNHQACCLPYSLKKTTSRAFLDLHPSHIEWIWIQTLPYKLIRYLDQLGSIGNYIIIYYTVDIYGYL